MTEDDGSSIFVKAVTGVLLLLFLYLMLTALPAFLGMAGILSGPAGPRPIADALARVTLAGVVFGLIIVVEKIEQRLRSGET